MRRSSSISSSGTCSSSSASVAICTDSNAPSVIEQARASSPASPVISTVCCENSAPATPMTRLRFDTRPSFAPSTAARSALPPPAPCRPSRREKTLPSQRALVRSARRLRTRACDRSCARIGVPSVCLQIVVVAVDRLEVLHRRQNQLGPKAAREPDQDASAPVGVERRRLFPLLGDLPGPEARMGLLDFGEATVDIGQLGFWLDAGERAVKRGAVDLALQIVAVARQVGGFHAAFAACARTSRSKASARFTLSRFIIRSPWPAELG